MREELLHFIWKSRYFNHRELTTEAGEQLFIHYPGDPNTDQGPDFKNARITIGDRRLEGAVELHPKTTDWFRHGHTGDPHYRPVILHVVWEHDTTSLPANIPVLILRDRTPKTLLPRFSQFMTDRAFVPCERLRPAAHFSPAFRQQLLEQRLTHRAAFIRTLLDENRPHWDEIIFRLIARSLGQPVNTDAFLTIAESLPLSRLLRRRSDPARVTNLLLEQAARLTHPLSFSRMRPAHSPYVRFGQLAAILNRYTGWFTILVESGQPGTLLATLDVKTLGAATKHSILINAFIPFLYTYGILRQEPPQRAKALRWLEQAPAENNTVIRRWQDLGFPARTAADTQALLELRKTYCTPIKCLECAIGRSLLIVPPAKAAAAGATNPSTPPAAPYAITGQ